ncbi:MAG: Lrp/AsnC family transcriptional regulator [Actinobacteria bacterium]|nr:MAG: Lrp/AsnC family transcriptional regulator [Actinomycetota bacterium]
MDEVDRKILNIIQTGFPVVPRPYDELAKRVGETTEEVMDRVRRLKAEGVVRRIGATFDSARLGYASTLCAAEVPANRVEEVAAVINSYDNVTHNYLREDRFNIWFTVIAESSERIEEILDEIRARTGVDRILNLPAVRMFKVRVSFEL